MVLKLAFVTVAVAALAAAANYKRVTCPDGKNTVSNEAVSILSSFLCYGDAHIVDPVLRFLRLAR